MSGAWRQPKMNRPTARTGGAAGPGPQTWWSEAQRFAWREVVDRWRYGPIMRATGPNAETTSLQADARSRSDEAGIYPASGWSSQAAVLVPIAKTAGAVVFRPLTTLETALASPKRFRVLLELLAHSGMVL